MEVTLVVDKLNCFKYKVMSSPIFILQSTFLNHDSLKKSVNFQNNYKLFDNFDTLKYV